jgi:O-antigen/teichoic acid export membrane protein
VQLAAVAGAAVYLVAASLLYAFDELGVTEVLILYGVSVALPWLLQLVWVGELGELRPSFETKPMRRLVGVALRFHPAHVTLYLLLKLDVLLVGAILDVESVGLYSIAVMLADPLWLITNTVVSASVPFQLSRSQPDAARLVFKAARFNLALAFAASVLIAASCWFWIPALFGSGFEDSAAALVLLLPGVCALAVARPFSVLLPRTGNATRYVGVTVAALGVNCVLNVVLLPEVGIIGASIASSVGYGLMGLAFVLWGLKLGRLTAGEALLPQPDDAETLQRAFARVTAWRSGDRRRGLG